MTSKYHSKFSRCRNLVNLAIGIVNNGDSSDGLGYKSDESTHTELSSPLPFEADDILNNYSNLNLLQDIFDDDEELNQSNQNNTLEHNVSIAPIQLTQPLDKEHYTDSHLNNQEPNEPTIENVSLSSPIIISTSNSLHEISVSSHGCDSQESIRMTNEPDIQDIRSEHTPMPSPNGSNNLFGDEEPIPSVASLLTDDNVSSPFSQYSSGEVSVPLSSRKRRFTKKRDWKNG
ncbi:hypothetical protein evm_012479 [Chilo suppressalis]|nr:hypothetical protein evm_012479 [Chilo suppressalis]